MSYKIVFLKVGSQIMETSPAGPNEMQTCPIAGITAKMATF